MPKENRAKRSLFRDFWSCNREDSERSQATERKRNYNADNNPTTSPKDAINCMNCTIILINIIHKLYKKAIVMVYE